MSDPPSPGSGLAEPSALTTPTKCVLSVVMPAYNEAATLEQTIHRVLATDTVRELIIVDDGSTDDTPRLLQRFTNAPNVRVVHHPQNRGKGAALRTGLAQARAPVVLVQDADLEYDPADYPALVEPIVRGEADVVYGSRFLDCRKCRIPPATYWANRGITWLFNAATGQRLTDVETCYKAIRRDALQQVLPLLQENRFGIEIELTARLAQLPGIRIIERPIAYAARSYTDGKKINWRDGLRALWCIFKYRRSKPAA